MKPMNTLKIGPYSCSEDEILKTHYPIKGKIWCAQYLGRAILSVRARVERLGLKMNPEARKQLMIKSHEKPNDWYKINPEQFFNVTKPEAAYILGFLWADGYVKIPKRINGGNYIIALNISKTDFEALTKAFNPLGEWGTYKINKTSRHRVETICIRTGNKPLVEFLVKHDYSIKSIAAPTKILSHIPEHLRHYWWRGYFDGDGTFSCKKRSYVLGFSGAYDADWREHQMLLDSLGIKNHFFQEKRSTGRCSSIIVYNISNVVRFGEYIYAGYESDGIGLKRKWDKYLIAKGIETTCNRINSVKFDEPRDFIHSLDDIVCLVKKYPESLSRAKVLEHFDISKGSFDNMIYRLRKSGVIQSKPGKCVFYTLTP